MYTIRIVRKAKYNMKIIFRSKDFASIDAAGLGFNNRRPMAANWHYQGRIQHPKWNGTYQCHWDGPKLIWTIQGDERLFGLAAALKSKGYAIDVEQDKEL